MKNKEVFAAEIIDIALHGGAIAIMDGKPAACAATNCTQCDLCGTPYDDITEWAEAEYVPLEGEVDWSKVPVDTPILVRDAEYESWHKRHFAMYENETVYAWVYGSTSWSLEWNANRALPWNYAKLASHVSSGEEEPDWRKVPADTPIMVRNTEHENWVERNFVEFRDGCVFTYGNGCNSQTPCPIVDWRYARLKERVKNGGN